MFFRSRLSRWLSAVVAVGGVALVVGQCQRGETSEDVPRREAGLRPTEKSAKPKLTVPEDVLAWSKRYEIQQPPPEELRADPAQQAGTLGNGMRYIVREDAVSAGAVSLRLMVLAGSMHEATGEEGYAHFIEHLAFQETEEGNAVDVFERLGLAAGADVNAHTALDHTLYRLDLPMADDAALETACVFLSRAAGGLNFSDASVETERRIILRELDERPGSTDFFRRAAAILPGVPVLLDPPGGTRESVGAASRAGLWNFWHRNYVPSRMVVVAVGDLKEGPMIERLRRHFGSIASRSAPADPDLGDPMAEVSSPVAIHDDAKESEVTLAIAAPHPIDREPDSLAKRRQELVRTVALKMLESRIAREFSRLDVAGTSANGAAVEVIPGMGWLQVSAHASRPNAPGTLKALVRAWRAALGSEFHHSEFREACGKARSALRGQFLLRLTQGAASTSTRLADAERTGRLVESPEDELNRSQSILRTLMREECEELLKTEWAVLPRFLLSGPVDAALADEASGIVTEAMNGGVPAYMHGTENRAWIAEPPGSPGRIIRRQLDEGRGFLEAELANHVLVRLAPIPSLGGFVMVNVDIGHGNCSLPSDKPALATAAELICRWYPLQNWSHLALNAALAGDDVSRSFYVGHTSFQWTGMTDRKQLGRQLDLLAAAVHRPGIAAMPRVWHPDAQAREWDERNRRNYSRRSREIQRVQSGFDPRFELYPEGLMQTDSTQAAEWLLPLLAGERLCVTIAGDFEPEVALAAVAASFGGLPERPVWEDASPFPPPPLPDPGVTKLPLGKKGVASVVLMFPLGPAGDTAEMLRRKLLDDTLQLRVRDEIREKRGESYAPSVHCSMVADHATEWLIIDVPCERSRAEEVSGTLRELVHKFRDEGWTRDEFQRAVRPLPHLMAGRSRSPFSVASKLTNPARIPARQQIELSALTAMEGEVRALAKRVLDLEVAVELQVEE